MNRYLSMTGLVSSWLRNTIILCKGHEISRPATMVHCCSHSCRIPSITPTSILNSHISIQFPPFFSADVFPVFCLFLPMFSGRRFLNTRVSSYLVKRMIPSSFNTLCMFPKKRPLDSTEPHFLAPSVQFLQPSTALCSYVRSWNLKCRHFPFYSYV